MVILASGDSAVTANARQSLVNADANEETTAAGTEVNVVERALEAALPSEEPTVMALINGRDAGKALVLQQRLHVE